MGEYFTRPSMRERRRALRSSMTGAERILWSELRGRRLAGCRFRRQHSLGGFVADFYSPECGLVIEVDGGCHQHEQTADHDRERDIAIAEHGIATLRFTNEEITYELRRVLATISAAIAQRRSGRS